MVSLTTKVPIIFPLTLVSMTASKLKVSGKRWVDEVKIRDPVLVSDRKRKEEREREQKTGSEEEKGKKKGGGTKCH